MTRVVKVCGWFSLICPPACSPKPEIIYAVARRPVLRSSVFFVVVVVAAAKVRCARQLLR